jgi:hypothetical protein
MSTKESLKFWTKFRRWFAKTFHSSGHCHGSCYDCDFCPWIDKEKYSFEIRRKNKHSFDFVKTEEIKEK